jgi:non-specific serine/threonine protein kinase
MAATYRGRLVVMGGWIPEGDVLSARSSNRVWELRGDRWQPLPPMNSPRVAGGAVVVGDKLVVAGGQNQGRLVPSTEIFDGKEWKKGANIPTPREHLGVVTDGRDAYAVGGRELASDKNVAALERYDPAKDEWEKLPGMPKPLGGLGAAFAAGRVVAVGAETPNGVLGTTLLYDVAREKWSSADSLPKARHGLSVAAVGRTVYALGGALQPGHTNSTNEADALTLEKK